MLPELEELRLLRQQLGLTQQALAQMAGVSQSLITKIERGTVQPSFVNVKRLKETLESERNRRHPPVTVGATCSRNVVWVEASDTVREAANAMRKHGFSQMPVRRRGAPVGSISDRLLSKFLATTQEAENLGRKRVEEVMADPFPHLPSRAPLHAAAALLQFVPAVLVVREADVIGVITKSDLLKVLAR